MFAFDLSSSAFMPRHAMQCHARPCSTGAFHDVSWAFRIFWDFGVSFDEKLGTKQLPCLFVCLGQCAQISNFETCIWPNHFVHWAFEHWYLLQKTKIGILFSLCCWNTHVLFFFFCAHKIYRCICCVLFVFRKCSTINFTKSFFVFALFH